MNKTKTQKEHNLYDGAWCRAQCRVAKWHLMQCCIIQPNAHDVVQRIEIARSMIRYGEMQFSDMKFRETQQQGL